MSLEYPNIVELMYDVTADNLVDAGVFERFYYAFFHVLSRT